jgi:hypothetical protein
MNRPYRVGEIVLMDWRGWLKAFKVVAVHSVLTEGDVETVEYQMAMVETEQQWTKPDRSA